MHAEPASEMSSDVVPAGTSVQTLCKDWLQYNCRRVTLMGSRSLKLILERLSSIAHTIRKTCNVPKNVSCVSARA